MLRKIYTSFSILLCCTWVSAQKEDQFMYAGIDINGTEAYAYIEKDLGDTKEVWEKYIVKTFAEHAEFAQRPMIRNKSKLHKSKAKNSMVKTETYYNYMQYNCSAGNTKALRQIKTQGSNNPILIKDEDFSQDEIIKHPEEETNTAYMFQAICQK